MNEFDLIVKNGTVATAADVVRCDIGVRGGKIVALADQLSGATTEIDAHGLIVTPGGIDAHCHLDQPMTDGSQMADGFESGTISAAFGGTTTVIPFACQLKGQTLRMAVDDYHERARDKSVIDYAFHLIIADPTEQVLRQELPKFIENGYTSFKIYMTYDDLKLNDRQILDTMTVAKRYGAMTMLHAENSECIEWLTEQLLVAGKTAPKHHADSRPPAVEREATHRAITLAEVAGIPVLIVHVSSADAMAQIQAAQANGLNVFAETCPQYLFLTSQDLDLQGFEGAKCVCSPPPRDTATQEIIWRGLANGVFQVFSSDHAPFRFQDDKGKKRGGVDVPFQYIPNGIPGLETRMPLLFSEGVGKGRIRLTQFVALTATNAARIYGLYPRKGSIAIGADADLVIWDSAQETVIRNAALHHNVDYTPYEGMALIGWPKYTLSRGEIICADGNLRVKPGRGRFLPCGVPEPVKQRRQNDLGTHFTSVDNN